MLHTPGTQRVEECLILSGVKAQVADRRSVANPGRSFFPVAPPMRRPDIVWVVVSPRSPHSFGISMIRHDISVVGELFVTDGTLPVLVDDFPV
jgi:hypothetical protein